MTGAGALVAGAAIGAGAGAVDKTVGATAGGAISWANNGVALKARTAAIAALAGRAELRIYVIVQHQLTDPAIQRIRISHFAAN
jgi:hypothetical protein